MSSHRAPWSIGAWLRSFWKRYFTDLRSVSVTRYTVRAKSCDQGWELHIDDVGVTQASVIADADSQARYYLATLLGGDPMEYLIDLKIEH